MEEEVGPFRKILDRLAIVFEDMQSTPTLSNTIFILFNKCNKFFMLVKSILRLILFGLKTIIHMINYRNVFIKYSVHSSIFNTNILFRLITEITDKICA